MHFIVLLGVGRGALNPVVILWQRLHADRGAVTHHVQEEVGGDAVQPALKGAWSVVLQAAEDAHERFLREILGIVLVTGEAVGQSIHIVRVLLHQFAPARHVSGTRVEFGGG